MLRKVVPKPDSVRVEGVEVTVYSRVGSEKGVCIGSSDNVGVGVCINQVIEGDLDMTVDCLVKCGELDPSPTLR